MSTQFVRSVIVTVLSLTERLKARTVRVRVLTAVLLRVRGQWGVTLCLWVNGFRRFGETLRSVSLEQRFPNVFGPPPS